MVPSSQCFSFLLPVFLFTGDELELVCVIKSLVVCLSGFLFVDGATGSVVGWSVRMRRWIFVTFGTTSNICVYCRRPCPSKVSVMINAAPKITCKSVEPAWSSWLIKDFNYLITRFKLSVKCCSFKSFILLWLFVC